MSYLEMATADGMPLAALHGIWHLGERPVRAMEVPKKHVVHMLRVAGLPYVAEEAQRVLPDPVKYERAESFLAKYGITKDGLISRRGGSP